METTEPAETVFAAFLAAPAWYRALVWGMLACGGLTFGVLHAGGITAAYGRYSRPGFGPLLEPRLAWCAQELPALLVPLFVWVRARGASAWSPPLPLALLMVHYAHRALVYPFRIRGGKPTPLVVCALAFLFCCWNGVVQGVWWARLAPATCCGPAVALPGAALWALGAAVNVHSDATLRALRAPGETGYKVPRGGLFELVSGANFAGEICEWCGYALASGGALPCVAFAAYTVANMAPRAAHHHAFYRRTFKGYPPKRRALVPFLW